ncbi:hypothetical protein MSG_01878 [Mycobacterium shigaense]|uniref:Predicted hydrolase N-terminal domain-containing protein n=1 Tax=Mycobacterium shigaense TaxID=722731 RepID=A0A1Z4EGE4_9MYCO|nr:hypothetical protein MSG_01878 [Mycobacterium shigaense]
MVQLQYISVLALIGEAGGDPWAVNQSLQAGSPAQISGLAEAYHSAGRCTAESANAFDEARKRFEASWNRDGGEHPINDSAQVQRTVRALGAQSEQLPKIAVNLETIAAALAGAQKAGGARIAALETQLQILDKMIGQAVEMEKSSGLTAADRQQLDTFITGRENDAINDTKSAVQQLNSIRDHYANTLRQAQANGGLGPQNAELVSEFKLGGGEGFPSSDPRIIGPAGPPQHEQNTYDLQDQFQDGQGPTFGGDPRDGFPRSPASQLAQGPPGTRPLPTGTALGPNGKRYGFFSNPDGSVQEGVNEYATNGSVWDFTNPDHPVKVGDLPGISQASGVYDAATNKMIIVGNGSNKTGDLTRGLWVSGPVDPANPNGWMNSLQRVGDVSLPGDRESQLVALKGGGYMLVGATNGGPIQAISAATPQGLMGATPQTLIDAGKLPTVYGPTVTGTTIDPATGLETVQLRVSTWPPGPTYDPNTWTTTFGVQH